MRALPRLLPHGDHVLGDRVARGVRAVRRPAGELLQTAIAVLVEAWLLVVEETATHLCRVACSFLQFN